MFRTKRIYDEPSASDGYRVLVDRLWPRGITKDRAALDAWMKDIAPSPQLRTWFGHDPSKFEEFSQKYLDELEQNTAPVDKLYELEKQHKDITLLYAAHHPAINHARVLQQFLTARQR